MPYSSKEKQAEYHRKYAARNREKLDAYQKAWRDKNREKVRNAQRARTAADPEKYREYFRNHRIRKKYGLTEAQYAEWVVKQNGKCGICGKEPSGTWHGDRMLNVDHCHDTGAVRGLLCNKCNRALGLFGDGVAQLEAAIRYLQQ